MLTQYLIISARIFAPRKHQNWMANLIKGELNRYLRHRSTAIVEKEFDFCNDEFALSTTLSNFGFYDYVLEAVKF